MVGHWIFDVLLVVILGCALEYVSQKRNFMGSLFLMFYAYGIAKIVVLTAIVGKFGFPITTDLRIHYTAMAITSAGLFGFIFWYRSKVRSRIAAAKEAS